MKEYFRLLKFVRKDLSLFIFAFICMGFSALFDGAKLTMIIPVSDVILSGKHIVFPEHMPAFIVNFVSKVNSLDPFFLLKIVSVLIIVLFFFRGIFQFLQSFLMSIIGQRAVLRVRGMLYAKFQDLSLDFYSQKRAGELVSRITNDVGLISNALSSGLTDLIYQSMQIIVFSFLAFYIYTKMALVIFVIFPLIVFPVLKIGKRIKKLATRSQESMADLNTILVETIGGVRIVKGFSREEHEIKRFGIINRNYYRYMVKTIKRTLILAPLTEFTGAAAAIAIFLIGGHDVISGKISFGVFGAFLGFLMSLIKPAKSLSKVYSLNQQALAASKRIYNILDREPLVRDKPSAKELAIPQKEITMDNVWFKYSASEDYTLKDINFTAKVGEITAIVGPTGSGKTTLLNLIPRFYDSQKGRVLFDGIDIRDVTIASLRKILGVVTQEVILFNDTVKANIAYGKLAASDKEIEEAARKALAYDFIKQLPKGFDTFIGDRGFRLSGGEKQRISIARAILKNPKILILDEATSQLDSESEQLVQKALDNLMRGKTVLVVAHRLSTIKNANKILVIKEGKIIAEGSHSELLENSDLYRRLYELQFNM